jgi:hypothetical protein
MASITGGTKNAKNPSVVPSDHVLISTDRFLEILDWPDQTRQMLSSFISQLKCIDRVAVHLRNKRVGKYRDLVLKIVEMNEEPDSNLVTIEPKPDGISVSIFKDGRGSARPVKSMPQAVEEAKRADEFFGRKLQRFRDGNYEMAQQNSAAVSEV